MTPREREGGSLRRRAAVVATVATGFLVVWAAAGGGRSGPAADDGLPRLPPLQGEVVPFTRVGAGPLEIPMPGVLAVRDAATWRALLTRYPPSHRPPDSVAPVDFARETLLLAGYGGATLCRDPGTFVQRVERIGDTLGVTLAYGYFPEQPDIDCAAVPTPLVDVVRVPHTDLPVRFVGWTPGFPVPPAAPWLERPTAAQTDTLSVFLRPLFRRFLAADSATPHRELARLAATLRDEPDGGVAAALLGNPRVRTDLPLLRELLANPRVDRRTALETLLAHHGARLARDARTDSATLRLLIRAVQVTADSSPVPRTLARHPRVLRDSALAHELYHGSGRPQIPCADLQRLWWAKKAAPRHTPVCTPWDDSPVPPGVKWPAPPPPLVQSDDTMEVIHGPGAPPPRFRPRPPRDVADGPAAQ